MSNRLTYRKVLPTRDHESDEMTGAEIILGYFREKYQPDFRRGHGIHSQTGETVHQNAACGASDFTIIGRLASATDAPRFPDNGIKRDSLPGFFRKWAPVAWGELLSELPDEDEAALGVDSLAADEFRRMVRDAMLSEVQFGDTIKGTNVTQVKRASLIDWCSAWAKPGPWRSIRSKKCWCKIAVLESGLRLRVAVRQELFGQVNADKLLRAMNQNTFTRRAARYGVGSSHRDDRPHGLAAVVFEDEFTDSLTAGITDPENLAHDSDSDIADGPDQKPDDENRTQMQ